VSERGPPPSGRALTPVALAAGQPNAWRRRNVSGGRYRRDGYPLRGRPEPPTLFQNHVEWWLLACAIAATTGHDFARWGWELAFRQPAGSIPGVWVCWRASQPLLAGPHFMPRALCGSGQQHPLLAPQRVRARPPGPARHADSAATISKAMRCTSFASIARWACFQSSLGM
jgi:hypothetical protein